MQPCLNRVTHIDTFRPDTSVFKDIWWEEDSREKPAAPRAQARLVALLHALTLLLIVHHLCASLLGGYRCAVRTKSAWRPLRALVCPLSGYLTLMEQAQTAYGVAWDCTDLTRLGNWQLHSCSAAVEVWCNPLSLLAIWPEL